MSRVVLCYHQVAPFAEAGRSLNIEPSRLESHIQFFRRHHYGFVLAKDILMTLERTVCFTFDDAYNSTLTYGLEVLRRQRVPATFYTVPSQVGQRSAWDGDKSRPLASWNQLREASEEGYEIGNHTMTHAHLPTLGSAAQEKEWRDAHEALLHQGFAPSSACYPYGQYAEESGRALKTLGYASACSIEKWPHGQDPYRIARIVIAYGDSIPMLIYKLWIRPLLP